MLYNIIQLQNASKLVILFSLCIKVKFIPQQAEVAQGVPGRLRLRIFLTFGTTRVVGRQPYAPYSFSEAESAPGHMIPSGATEKKIPSDTTGNRFRDLPTSSAVP